VIIAGPNGSGKSTAATMLLPADFTYVNADKIAEELTGKPGTTADINAGRILLDRLAEKIELRQDFAFETTLATRGLAANVRDWQEAGYRVHLFFLWLPSDDLAVQRVQARVRDGGHNVPESTIRRRFRSGQRNLFELYLPLVDVWRIYDNSRVEEPRLIARGSKGVNEKVSVPQIWSEMARENCL
jgi:predicted ABC-type ATPase